MRLDHSPLPWTWLACPGSRRIGLYSGLGRGQPAELVMDTARWGLFGTRPRFRAEGDLVGADEFARPFPGARRRDSILTVDHPDARLMAEAPRLYGVLKAVLEAIEPDPKAFLRICPACQGALEPLSGLMRHRRGCPVPKAREAIDRVEREREKSLEKDTQGY